MTLNTSRFWPRAKEGGEGWNCPGTERRRRRRRRRRRQHDPLFLCGESVCPSDRRSAWRASTRARSRNTCRAHALPSRSVRREACCLRGRRRGRRRRRRRRRCFCFHSVHAVAIIIIIIGLISNSSSSSCACLPSCGGGGGGASNAVKLSSTVKETTTFHDSRFYP